MTRMAWAFTTCVATWAVAISAFVHLPTKLIWNASASVPLGLYTVQPPDGIKITDIAVIEPPEPLAEFMSGRGYLPPGVPLLKRVVALPGQQVCRNGLTISVDGTEMGKALQRDHLGRDLPVWRGCRLIAKDEAFVMNQQSTDSLDGRYFGPLPVKSIVGKATPLWTDEEGNGRFEWHAAGR